jgi:DNA-binding NarL/FixJ family response regulator
MGRLETTPQLQKLANRDSHCRSRPDAIRPPGLVAGAIVHSGPDERIHARAAPGEPPGRPDALPIDNVVERLNDWSTSMTIEGGSTLIGRSRGEQPHQWDDSLLIVDDCTLYRENLAAVFAANGAPQPTIAWDLASLRTALTEDAPDLVLINLNTRDSATLLRAIFEITPNMRVIVLAMSEDDESEIVACAEAGVAGYHMRTDSLDDLLVLIRKVAAGEAMCSPRVSSILLRRLSALASQRQPVVKELVLTAREAQILAMLEMGLSNRDIAARLCIAVHTVKNHVHSVLTKLEVNTRAEAAALSRTIRYTKGGHRN